MRTATTSFAAAGAAIAVAAAGGAPVLSTSASGDIMGGAKPQPVEAEAVLQVPAVDYRKEWVQLGTFSVLADKPADGAKQLHVVYTERQNVEAYLRTGRFPDGAVLVKDGVGRLGTGPRFGDGWGWAFYEGAEMKRTVTTNYKNDCLPCHEPARGQDLLYIRGYPLLRR